MNTTHGTAANTTCCHTKNCGSQPPEQNGLSTAYTENPKNQSECTIFSVPGMDCPVEEALIRKSLGSLQGLGRVECNLLSRRVLVRHEAGMRTAIAAALESLNLGATVLEDTQAPAAQAAPVPWKTLALAGVFALASETGELAGLAPWFVLGTALAAIALSGIDTYKQGFRDLFAARLTMNTLMSVAVTGAVLIGQWPEAAMVMVLFTVAEYIEVLSLERARKAIRQLLSLAPEQATVLGPDGAWTDIPVAQVTAGSRVRVKPGERIALDGLIAQGFSTVDQAPITGESLPVEKQTGDTVFAGTINQSGSFIFTVTAMAGDTTLARIIHAVENAQESRAPINRFIDRFAEVYTPAVFALALAVALVPPALFGGDWLEWLRKGLILLVVACPCALVISTPVTIVSGLAAAAKQGILIKGGAFLEIGRTLRRIAFDKTGTITRGKPQLTNTIPLLGGSNPAVLALAASLANRSDHPVSQAIAQAAAKEGLALSEAENFQALPGRGVSAVVQGRLYHLGNRRLLEELGFMDETLAQTLSELEEEGKTALALIDPQGAQAVFAVADTVKESSKQAIAELRALGIDCLMLTGDNPHTAKAIAAQVGIERVHANLLPEDKLAIINDLVKLGPTGMTGDGINDAPALARADVGFAMGVAGSDTAIETADVAFMDDDLRKLPRFIRLSAAARRILVQNISFSLATKLLFVALTFFGFTTMWMAVFADTGVSLLVVANGLRMLRA